ncbi:PDR/VanB family oxidoreductase [Conexibacter stalactiti]|uniref:PDR/VanB family oxidoreductase n=1 Tax=Conexibacter stalactiti TaxID=1940611 RepID=A0ABU4HL80_9ACTN|nr:PDR/VanB family oxidoreductase [Conexibacter stalactiti]MDW5594076.1 PDR/VanB family oxidoreductase [Conexibacter stalactiti]MEC5034718.1 PDR/VanB family oxidoreductase [Conexibacter stalactiti]
MSDVRDERLVLRVERIERLTPAVRAIRLVDPRGHALPSFTPGSHVVVECGGRRNAYSLTGPTDAPDHYAISVRLDVEGAGGSRWLHERLGDGDQLVVSPPRSAFAPARSARKHLFVAGGIGITPILSHVRAARRWGDPFTLLYAHRRDAATHVPELERLCGDRLSRFRRGADLGERLTQELTAQPLGTHLYVCGPGAMSETVLAAARAAGWPEGRLHSERFSADELSPGRPFTAVLARSGTRLRVPSGVTLLEALEAVGAPVSSLCRQGVCGECRVGVRAGRPEHRDLYLSGPERLAGDSVMCCVSRAEDDELELDL